MLWDNRRQTWHDEIAGTYVICVSAASATPLHVTLQPSSLATLSSSLPNLRRACIILLSIGAVVLAGYTAAQLYLSNSELRACSEHLLERDVVLTELVGTPHKIRLRHGWPTLASYGEFGFEMRFDVKGTTGSTEAALVVITSGNHEYGCAFERLRVKDSSGEWVEEDSLAQQYCDSHVKLGTLLLAEGSDTAYVHYRRAINLSRGYSSVLRGREFMRDYPDRANDDVHWTTITLAKVPGDLLALGTRGYAYCLLNKPDSGLTDFNAVLAAHPWVFTTYADKAWAFELLGQIDSAKFYYDYYLTIEPDTMSLEYRFVKRRLDVE
jgi:tetratricopeptide (TPR) repeat protein